MTPEESVSPLSDGRRLLEAGNLESAIPLLARAVRISPGSFDAHLALGQAYARKAKADGPSFRALAEREFAEAVRTVRTEREKHDELAAFAAGYGFAEKLLGEYRDGRFSGLAWAPEFSRTLESAPKAAPAAAGTGARILRENWILAAGVAGALALVSWGMLRQAGDGGTPRPAPTSAGEQAAEQAGDDFTLAGVDGSTVSLSSFRGKNVVIVDFWATWCGPCRATMPALQKVLEKYRNRGLVVLSVNLREDAGKVRSFMDQNGYQMTPLLDSDGAVAGRWGVRGIPTLVVIDKEGVARHREVGARGDLELVLGNILEGLL